MAPLLSVKNLRTTFKRHDGIVKAVDGISYTLERGETMGIVGESGSGKSVSVLSLLHLLRKNGKVEEGEAVFDGRDLLKMKKEELRQIRGKDIGMIFQDPMTSLNPTIRIGRQMMEPSLWHRLFRKSESKSKVLQLLKRVGIPEYQSRFRDFPFQFSGGMRQRVMIAMSLTCGPKLIIADEPTTALDATVRSQILNLMQDMKDEFGTSIILITHDFCMASNFCDKLIVMYAGKVMESAPTKEILGRCLHPYSRGLLGSCLDIDKEDIALHPIGGNPPNLIDPPKGCCFHPRCDMKQEICETGIPALREIRPNHWAACHFAEKGTNNG
jgi:peptide/nickel transport system ATP-binding protein